MTLLELCEPLFQYLCQVNRSARKGGHLDHTQVRANIESIFNEILSKGSSDPVLHNHLDQHKGKIELVLAFFVDFMIKESKISFAKEWKELAGEKYNELAGDEKFWDLLEESLTDRSESANERLAVFYTCMGLGFTGWYTGQPEFLRKKMVECQIRIRDMMDVDDMAPIIKDSELYVNTDNLIVPPGRSLVGIGIASVVLVIVLFLGNIMFYLNSTSDLSKWLDIIIDSRPAAAGSDQSSRVATEPLD